MTPKGRILVVDDEENILSSLEGILHDDGYDVVTAGEGEAALKIIASEHPDLVLLDIWLPGMDGLEVLKSAKKSGVEAEFIMMSGHGSIDTAVQATKMGAFDFIEKPLSLEDVLLMAKLAMEKKHAGCQVKVPESPDGFTDGLIGVSEDIENIRGQLKSAWNGDKHILISGEPGTGKTLVANMLYSQIRRAGRPCVWVDGASLPKKQANKILFGGTKGPTGGGKFEEARNGTLIVDGVEELPLNLQNKILKTLKAQENPSENEGGKPARPPVRIVAILSGEIEGFTGHKGVNFELLELLGQESIRFPALRRRPKDILTLADHFLSRKYKTSPADARALHKDTTDLLCRYAWPGNVAELKHVMENIPHKTPGGTVGAHDLPDPIRFGTVKSPLVVQEAAMPAKDADGPYPMQRTLKRSVVLCGQGLHSGIKTGLILSPLPPDSGIVFCDISTGETIRAHLDYVNSTDYATGLRKGKKVVRTTEHILAALHMYHINNLLIKMGDEVPIMDGSAADFCELIEDGGIEKQDRVREELVIDKKYSLDFSENNGKSMSIEPAEALTVHYILDYPLPIGLQEFYFTFAGEEHFKREIAPARTFGFLKDYEKLEEMGLATGGRLSNLILLDDEKVINTTLRFPDEFVRHKILDIIGDFYLLGRPVKGKITAKMTGHRENISLLRKVREGLSLS